MTTKRESIMAFVATTLASTPGVSGRVYRSRPEPVRREETPCIIIEPVQESADYTVLDYVDWTLQFKATVFTRSSVADSAADAVVQDAYARLMADRTLGNRVFDITPSGVYYNISEGDLPVGITDLMFNIRYRTKAADLTQ